MNEMTLQLNKTEETVKTFLEKNSLIAYGMHVCVCLSGGVDSCVLLYILHRLRHLLALRLSACHLNHMIRGEEAECDEIFCEMFCRTLDIPFFSKRINIPALQSENGKSMEETARDARYAWFSELGEKKGIDRFATAHHKNDQAETVLFHILRGTTVAGLSGIPVKREKIIRPLLCLSREEIEEYASRNAISFQTDSTNCSELYTRNYIRHTLFPLLKHVNTAMVDALVRLSVYAAEDQAFLETMLPAYEMEQSVSSLPDAILRRTIARNFTVFSGKTLCFQHVDEIFKFIRENRNGKVGLPGGYDAVIFNGRLLFKEQSALLFDPLSEGILSEGVTILCGGAVRITFLKCNAHFREERELFDAHSEFVYNLSTEIHLSCEGIYGMMRYRPRHPGDRLLLHGVNRSVKKLFSEQKVPVDLRQIIPVFFDDVGIVCIPFVAVSDRAFAEETNAGYSLRVEIADSNARKVVE